MGYRPRRSSRKKQYDAAPVCDYRHSRHCDCHRRRRIFWRMRPACPASSGCANPTLLQCRLGFDPGRYSCLQRQRHRLYQCGHGTSARNARFYLGGNLPGTIRCFHRVLSARLPRPLRSRPRLPGTRNATYPTAREHLACVPQWVGSAQLRVYRRRRSLQPLPLDRLLPLRRK